MQRRLDYIVLHSERGILELEVKDWKLATIRQMDRFTWQMNRFTFEIHIDRGVKIVINPLEQAHSNKNEENPLILP